MKIYASKDDVKVNSDAIAVLNGDSATDGSVDKKVADATKDLASKAYVDGLFGAYVTDIDTLIGGDE